MRPFTRVITRLLTTSLALGGLLVAGLTQAQQQYDQTLETGTEPTVTIEHVNGRAVVKTWDKDAVRIVGTLSEMTEKVEFEKRGTGVMFEVDTRRYEKDWRDFNTSEGDDLTIWVPADSKLDYSAVNADLEVQDITNSTVVDLVNGDIQARQLSGRVRLETVNGDITLHDVQGELVAESVNGDISGNHSAGDEARIITVNGDIDVTTASPQVRLESVNGSMAFRTGRLTELDIVTVNGNVKGQVELADNGDLNATSVGGTLDLQFQSEVSARFDLQAHAGGRIDNQLTDQQASKAKYGPNQWLEFSTGQASARAELSTVHGKIVLRRD